MRANSSSPRPACSAATSRSPSIERAHASRQTQRVSCAGGPLASAVCNPRSSDSAASAGAPASSSTQPSVASVQLAHSAAPISRASRAAARPCSIARGVIALRPHEASRVPPRTAALDSGSRACGSARAPPRSDPGPRPSARAPTARRRTRAAPTAGSRRPLSAREARRAAHRSAPRAARRPRAAERPASGRRSPGRASAGSPSANASPSARSPISAARSRRSWCTYWIARRARALTRATRSDPLGGLDRSLDQLGGRGEVARAQVADQPQ